MKYKIDRRRFVRLGGGVVLAGVFSPWVARAASTVTITHLDFLTPNDGTVRGDALGRNLKAFAEANPDIKVEIQSVPSTEIPQVLLRAGVVGTGPDTAKVHLPDLSGLVDSGSVVEPLDEYVSGWDKADWLTDWSHTAIKGQKYAIPYDYRPDVLLYRRSILEKYGVAVPNTWGETLAGAIKIGPENPIGYAVGLSLTSNADTLAEFFCSAVISAGGKIFNEDGTAAVNEEAGVMTFEWLKELFDKKGTSMATVNMVYNSVGDGITAGTIAMAMLGSQRYVRTAESLPPGELGVAPPPGWDAARPGQSNALIQTFMMSKYSTQKEAALRFIDFMTGPAAAANVAQGGEVPPRKSSYDTPYFATAEAAPINQFRTILVTRPGHVAYYPPRYWDMKQALASAAQSMVLQQTSPEAALDRAAESYNTLIGK